MNINKLTQQEFEQTFRAPMRNVTATAEPVLNIWPYVDAVPLEQLEGNCLSDGMVWHVYRNSTEQFEHVLVSTNNENIFLVIVVNLTQAAIHGHYLINLNQIYDLSKD